MLRHFHRDKAYALINVLSLSLALACSIILALYITSEVTYDQHNVNHERIFRIANVHTVAGRADSFAITSQYLGPLFLKEYPHAGQFIRVNPMPRTLLKYEDKAIYWEDIKMVDENMFEVFTHKAVYGDLSGALQDPSSIAVSESFARAYFGDQNPVGKTITDGTFNHRISAVFEDLPDNTHVKYNALIPMKFNEQFGKTDEKASPRQLFWLSATTYIMLSPELNQQDLQRLLDEFYQNVMSEQGNSYEISVEFVVQPLSKVHFDSRWEHDEPTGNILYVYGFIAVAVFILLVAGINYTNLAVARASVRSKEIGMRKILGAQRSQLILQFLGESVAYAIVALIVGCLLVYLAEASTPLMTLLGKSTLVDLLKEPDVLIWIVVGTLIVGAGAGAYPALYLSSIQPLSSLTLTKGVSRARMRELLVFVQLFVSVGVLASTIVMSNQMHYLAEKPLGYNKYNKVSIRLVGVDVLEKVPVIRNELLKNSNILGFTQSYFLPPGRTVSTNTMQIEDNQGQMVRKLIDNTSVGADFFEMMEIEIVQGRDFSKRLLTDIGTSVVVNETLVEIMGWDQPIGKRIQLSNSRVVGVMKDFHFNSLHLPMTAMFLRPIPEPNYSKVPPLQRANTARYFIVHIAEEDKFQTINYLEKVISQFDPEHPFEYWFFDDLLDEMYENERNLMQLTGAFSAICIFIACLGLFGIAAFTTEQRTKEIGIRRVLGASMPQIVWLLTKRLMLLVLVASLLASIVSYQVMTEWLSVFAYYLDVDIWVFIVSTFVVGSLAFVTIALRAAQSARTNPVNALRYE